MVASVPREALERVVARIPMGRLGKTEEMAQAVFFLIAYGDYITVTSGLKVGERVVISGNFLIDSESRMRSSLLPSSTNERDTIQTAANAGTPAFISPLKNAPRDPAGYADASVEVGSLAQVLGAHRGAYA